MAWKTQKNQKTSWTCMLHPFFNVLIKMAGANMAKKYLYYHYFNCLVDCVQCTQGVYVSWWCIKRSYLRISWPSYEHQELWVFLSPMFINIIPPFNITVFSFTCSLQHYKSMLLNWFSIIKIILWLCISASALLIPP